MNTPLMASQLSAPIPDIVKKRRVLLVDASHAKRDLRAEVLRKRGIYVDSAADIAEARSWWKPALYDLVLINLEKGGHRDKFCDDVRGAKPPQRLAFLVGQPEYLADSPSADQELLIEHEEEEEEAANGSAKASSAGDARGLTRWGILEASKRISEVRSASVARTRAMRAVPPPPRDSEGRPSKPTPATLDDLLREELR